MSEPADEPHSLELRSAMARRDYWRTCLAYAKAGGDMDAAINAQRFIDEYDTFIAIAKQRHNETKAG
jgi:hypothetical protein